MPEEKRAKKPKRYHGNIRGLMVHKAVEDKVVQLARERGVSVSTIQREALDMYLGSVAER